MLLPFVLTCCISRVAHPFCHFSVAYFSVCTLTGAAMKLSASSSAATKEETGAKNKFDMLQQSPHDESTYVEAAGGGFAKSIADAEAKGPELTAAIEKKEMKEVKDLKQVVS